MSYKFTTVPPGEPLNSILKNFFLIKFDKDTIHTDYLLPDGLPSFFYIQTREPLHAYFRETGQTITVETGFYVGYSNTVVELIHKRLKIIGASVYPVYFNMIFGKSPLDLINSFRRLDHIDDLEPVEFLMTASEDSLISIAALLEKYIKDQLNRNRCNVDFLLVYEKLIHSDGYYLKVEELAAFLGCSTRYFNSRFRQAFGMTPKKFIKLVRFNLALKYIYDRKDVTKLSSIAHEVGYHDQSHFIRDFKEICGKTPKEIVGNTDSLANKFRLF